MGLRKRHPMDASYGVNGSGKASSMNWWACKQRPEDW